MSFTFTVDHEHRRVTARAVGPITLDDIRNHLDEERGKSGLSYSELIDARGAVASFSTAEVRTIVNLLRRLGEGARLGPTAIVIDSDVGYGMLRMLGILLEIEHVCSLEPFRRPKDAERWLADDRQGND